MSLITRRNTRHKIRIEIWLVQQKVTTRIQRWMIDLGLVKKANTRMVIIPYPKFEDTFKPIVKKVMKELEADSFEHYGPFGLNCEHSYYWHKGFYKHKKERDGKLVPKIIGAIHLISRDNGWAIRNYRKKVGNYGEHSIAAMNGDNFQVIPIDTKLTHEKLMRIIKRR